MSRRSLEGAEATPWLGFWLRFSVITSNKARLAKLGVVAEPSESFWRVLVELHVAPDRGASVKEVREACEISEPTAARVLAIAKKAGYVKRLPHAQDGRTHLLVLTNEGVNALGKIFHAIRSDK